MEVHRSARQHGISDADIIQASTHFLVAYRMEDGDPLRELRLGFDSSGRLLEVVVLLLDDDRELTIHAMKARPNISICCHDPRKEKPVTKSQPSAHGQYVSDDTIDRLSHQAEAGYDVETLRRAGGRRPMGSSAARVVPVRLDPELDEALRKRVELEHSTTSTVIRDALRSWLESARG